MGRAKEFDCRDVCISALVSNVSSFGECEVSGRLNKQSDFITQTTLVL